MNAAMPLQPTADELARIGRGFGVPVHGAQQVFRAALEAMARPGRVMALPAAALADLEPPGLGRGLTALLLTLLDAETGVWLDPASAPPGAGAYLRFHTGARLRDAAADAEFVVLDAAQAGPAWWSRVGHGTDESPQSGATLIVAVPSLADDATPAPGLHLELRGPGIEHRQRLRVGGIERAFWQARAALEAEYPRGVDLILCCGDCLAALPRTTRITLED